MTRHLGGSVAEPASEPSRKETKWTKRPTFWPLFQTQIPYYQLLPSFQRIVPYILHGQGSSSQCFLRDSRENNAAHAWAASLKWAAFEPVRPSAGKIYRLYALFLASQFNDDVEPISTNLALPVDSDHIVIFSLHYNDVLYRRNPLVSSRQPRDTYCTPGI